MFSDKAIIATGLSRSQDRSGNRLMIMTFDSPVLVRVAVQRLANCFSAVNARTINFFLKTRCRKFLLHYQSRSSCGAAGDLGMEYVK